MILNAASLSLLLLFNISGLEALKVIQEKAMSVKLAENIKISCTTDSSSSYTYTWYQQKPGESPKFLLVSSTRASGLASRFTYSGSGSQRYLNINGVEAEDEAVYYCACHGCEGSIATFGEGTELTIANRPASPPTLLLLAPPQSRPSGSEVSVVCLARGFRPDGAALSWAEDGSTMAGPEVHTGLSQRQPDGTFIRSSVLKLSPERWSSGHTYTCHLTHPALSSPLRESVGAGQCS
ncbi:immunoglobulin lambda-1 light chain-like [Astyanax mexicanus]|uniref:Ig-like domain-containing protein n=1 Tax=Astyanax mexicanus TaxID=7994 RepID=A0A8B9HM56_ASTMX|nr:immunoglobulin lambda-1 light chain-like [Astyanax mexicanus]